jgi:hypothetical protein
MARTYRSSQFEAFGRKSSSSKTERTARSNSTGFLINGNAGRPRISFASSPICIRQGAVSIASRMALTPFEPPTVIVFQIGVSRAVGAVCACSAAKIGAELEGGFTHRGGCPAAWPVSNARGKDTTRWRARCRITRHSIAPPRLAIRSQSAVVPSRFDVTWVTQAGDFVLRA